MSRIPEVIKSALEADQTGAWCRKQTQELASMGKLAEQDIVKAVSKGIGKLVDVALSDHLLTADEETRVLDVKNSLSDWLDGTAFSATQERLVKAALMRDIQAGNITERVTIQGQLPILIGKNEKTIWLFNDVNYYETRTRTQYVGGSQGASIRIMKGVYYRVGAFKGERIQSDYVNHSDTGHLLITDKHLHFKGGSKAFRVPINKIISVEMLSDGIKIYKESANPRPQAFGVDDPWFASNVISLLA